jgi:phage shock protein C
MGKGSRWRLSPRDADKTRELSSYNYVSLTVGGQSMYCNYCGKLIQDDANVCAYCGIRVGASLARTQLVRPRLGRKVAGVCLGFAEYFDIDVSLVRVVWLITAIMTGVGFIPYLIAWIVMPDEPLLLPARASTQQVTTT